MALGRIRKCPTNIHLYRIENENQPTLTIISCLFRMKYSNRFIARHKPILMCSFSGRILLTMVRGKCEQCWMKLFGTCQEVLNKKQFD